MVPRGMVQGQRPAGQREPWAYALTGKKAGRRQRAEPIGFAAFPPKGEPGVNESLETLPA